MYYFHQLNVLFSSAFGIELDVKYEGENMHSWALRSQKLPDSPWPLIAHFTYFTRVIPLHWQLLASEAGTYPEIVPLCALIACNAMNWPGGTAIYLSHKFHHWLMLYTCGQYIVNVQWRITGDRFLTIFKFGIWALAKSWIHICKYSVKN